MAKKKAKASGRGGAREGAGRPKEIQGAERVKVTVEMSTTHAAALDAIAQEHGLRGRPAAVRWLIDQHEA